MRFTGCGNGSLIVWQYYLRQTDLSVTGFCKNLDWYIGHIYGKWNGHKQWSNGMRSINNIHCISAKQIFDKCEDIREITNEKYAYIMKKTKNKYDNIIEKNLHNSTDIIEKTTDKYKHITDQLLMRWSLDVICWKLLTTEYRS